MRFAIVLVAFLGGCTPAEIGVCLTAEQKCDDNRVLTCSAAGTWEVTLVCPRGTECRMSDADQFGPPALECAR